MKPETILQNKIIRAIGTRPDVRIWRSHPGGATLQGRFVRFGIPGQADLTGILPVVQVLVCPHCDGQLSTPPLGVRLEIEVKTESGRLSKDQQAFQGMVERFGGIYVVARSAEDVIRVIEGGLAK
ncbi:MAG TPA: VRR-NUC domain-containing protein [Planctomycetota bacterium]|nr:VRR-NUC domain-containing protein [Planctomycetota bacterium]